jgi:hypothetical protein
MQEAIEQAKESALKEGVDLMVNYTKQFVEALTPVAKQAYEIGLKTLQIDAASTLIYAFLSMLLIAFIAYWMVRLIKWAQKEDQFDTMMFGTTFGSVACLLIFIFSGSRLLSVWLWTKLFAPELWLAHQAVEKLLK